MPPEPAESMVSGLRLRIATGFGVGYSPLVPGTVGSLPGLALAWVLHSWRGSAALLVGVILVTALGFWSAGEAARRLGKRDPGPVVVDEIAGQMLTLLFVTPTMSVLALGFVLFRVLDVWKPFPARRLEDLPGGSGIMADDLAVAIYANLILHGAVRFFPRLMGTA